MPHDDSYYPYNPDASAYPLGVMLFFGVCFIVLVIFFSWAAYSDHMSFGPIDMGIPNNSSTYRVPESAKVIEILSTQQFKQAQSASSPLGADLKPPWSKTGCPVRNADIHQAMMSSVTVGSFFKSQ